MGAGEIIMCDRKGIICEGGDLTPAKAEIAAFTNKNHRTGTLADAMKGADILSASPLPESLQRRWRRRWLKMQ